MGIMLVTFCNFPSWLYVFNGEYALKGEQAASYNPCWVSVIKLHCFSVIIFLFFCFTTESNMLSTIKIKLLGPLTPWFLFIFFIFGVVVEKTQNKASKQRKDRIFTTELFIKKKSICNPMKRGGGKKFVWFQRPSVSFNIHNDISFLGLKVAILYSCVYKDSLYQQCLAGTEAFAIFHPDGGTHDWKCKVSLPPQPVSLWQVHLWVTKVWLALAVVAS